VLIMLNFRQISEKTLRQFENKMEDFLHPSDKK
jgi:hypothetical protein